VEMRGEGKQAGIHVRLRGGGYLARGGGDLSAKKQRGKIIGTKRGIRKGEDYNFF